MALRIQDHRDHLALQGHSNRFLASHQELPCHETSLQGSDASSEHEDLEDEDEEQSIVDITNKHPD